MNMAEMKCEACGMSFNSKEELMHHAYHVHGIGKHPDVRNSKEESLENFPFVGAIYGGILGGIVMAVLLVLGGMMMGTGAFALFMVIGVGLGAGMMSAVGVGLGLHFFVSIVAGLVFGVVVYAIKPFRKVSSVRGLGLGVLYGIVVYLVFFLPMAMKVLAPTMMKLMGPMAMGLLGSVLVLAFLGHLLYGLVLGYTTFRMSRSKESIPKGITA